MKHITLRILSGLVLIAVIAGIAFLAYNAGVARGTGSNHPGANRSKWQSVVSSLWHALLVAFPILRIWLLRSAGFALPALRWHLGQPGLCCLDHVLAGT